jgi:catechol 2,3-dioxygenase-like lactoylglutathione lyase family enzyme
MGVRRVVPDLSSTSLEAAKGFYGDIPGLRPVMDHGWILTLADPGRPSAQISLMTHDAAAPVIPDVSVQVDDVDACHAAAVQAGAETVYPLTLKPWDVRRFFAPDP